MKVPRQQLINRTLLLDIGLCEYPVNRVTLNCRAGLAYGVDALRRRKLEIEDKARLPVGLKKPQLSRRNMNPGVVHRGRRIQPGPVKHGMTVAKPFEGYSEVHFPRSECQDPAAPPVILSQIDTALLRPTAQLLNQAGFTAAGRSGDNDLAKAYTARNCDALDPVKDVNFDAIQ